MPDLEDKDVQMATKKIQMAFRAKKPKIPAKEPKIPAKVSVSVPVSVQADSSEDKSTAEKSSPDRLSEAKSLSFAEKAFPDADGSNGEHSSADR